jgi:hypothetical protein
VSRPKLQTQTNHGRLPKSYSYKMAVQISHSIYPKIPETAAIRSSEEALWRGVLPIGKA